MVEDDPALRRVVLDGLVEQDYVVDAVGSAEDALHQLSSAEYDMAVVDWRLPGMSGIELVAWIRRHRRPTGVLMLTARDTSADRIKGLDAGADDYLVKPFDFGELLARLRALARRPRAIDDPVLSCGGLSLDPARREVCARERVLALTATEYEMLELLMRRSPAVVSRPTLTNQIWAEDDIPASSGAIDVHLSRLRAKISGSGARILTVRGAGYRLEAA